jgi:hypothetical protein
MQLVGINQQVKNDTMRDALKASGFKIKVRKASWPRRKRNSAEGVRVDMSVGEVRNLFFMKQ